ncbi:MAG: 5-formyltetrahydrofolate cyclo-ligase [Candidatus Micrarchaeota archaeon]
MIESAFYYMVSRAKAALRKKMLELRNNLTEDEINTKSNAIVEKLFHHQKFKEASTIAVYLPKGSEVSTKKIILESLKMGKEVLVPVTNDHIEFYKFSSFEDLVVGKYEILEPKTKILPSREPDIIIIPGVCFGHCMHRIGYGKGCFDHYLKNSQTYRIGICFEFQVMEELPKHENDERMDEIITEKRIIM